MIDSQLKGKVVLVTGGNSGIGAEIVRAFAAQGARVVIHYLQRRAPVDAASVSVQHEVPGRDAAEAILAEVRAEGGEGLAIAADLGVPEQISGLFDAATTLGPVQVLVNNAAHCESPDDVRSASAGGIDRHFGVNVRAPVLLMRQFALRHEQSGGNDASIINVSTDAARAFANQIGYGASKAALEALTRSAAIELGPLGITVNAVAPGTRSDRMDHRGPGRARGPLDSTGSGGHARRYRRCGRVLRLAAGAVDHGASPSGCWRACLLSGITPARDPADGAEHLVHHHRGRGVPRAAAGKRPMQRTGGDGILSFLRRLWAGR